VHAEFPIIDGDGHVVEVDRDLKDYLPERSRAKDWNREYSFFPQDSWSFGTGDRHRQEVPTADEWLQFMDQTGIAATVLYPSNALTHGLIRHVDWSIDLARAYNDWLHDRFCRRSARLNGVALLPVQDVGACADELRRCVRELGFVGGLLPSVMAPLRSLGDRRFDPVYAAAEDLDTMLAVHGGAATGQSWVDAMQSYLEVRALKHAIPMMCQVTSMILHGVFDRYPRLRVAYLEAGVGWVPFLMDTLDEQYERKSRPWELERGRPSEYVKGDNVYFGFEPEERALPFVVEQLGAHKLIWPSDFPHERPREAFLHDLPEFFARTDLSDASRRLILSENPRRLYRLAVPAVR
jgi:predicted TIM-barrel fold metal-dependent hydrolase